MVGVRVCDFEASLIWFNSVPVQERNSEFGGSSIRVA